MSQAGSGLVADSYLHGTLAVFPWDLSVPRYFTAHTLCSSSHEISTSPGKPPPLHSFRSSTRASFLARGTESVGLLLTWSYSFLPLPLFQVAKVKTIVSFGNVMTWPYKFIVSGPFFKNAYPQVACYRHKWLVKPSGLKAGSPARVLVPALLSDLGKVISHSPCSSGSPSTKLE